MSKPISKLKLFMCLIKYHLTEMCDEWRFSSLYSHPQHYMEVSGQHHTLATLLLGGKAHSIHCIGIWVGPIAGLDVVVKRKIPAPIRNQSPVIQPIAHHFTD